MSFSPLANMALKIPSGGRYSPRYTDIKGFTVHGQAGVDAHYEAVNPNREVSAQYWITNEGAILPQINEVYRAFTTGHPGYPAGAESDHRNITVEVSNSPEGVRNKTWAISDAAKSALERLIGDVFKRHNLGPVHRGLVGGVAVHRDFVATECPGGYIMNNLGSIIYNAEQYRLSGGAPVPPSDQWEETMKDFKGKSSRKAKQTIVGDGAAQYVTFLDSHSDSKWGDRTIARGAGHIVGLEVNLGLSGPIGARAAITLVKERGANKDRVVLGEVRADMDTLKRAGIQIGWSGYLKAGELIRLLVQPERGKALVVESFYWSGMNRPG